VVLLLGGLGPAAQRRAHLLLVVMGLLAVGVAAAIMFEPASLRFRFMAP